MQILDFFSKKEPKQYKPIPRINPIMLGIASAIRACRDGDHACKNSVIRVNIKTKLIV